MIEWVKDNDTILRTNDAPATIEAAESLGWKRLPIEDEKPKKRAPAKKAAPKEAE